MKTTFLFSMLMIFAITGGCAGEKPGDPPAGFGIFETVKMSDIPGSLMDTLRKTNIRPEDDMQSPVIGYVLSADSFTLHADLLINNIRLLETHYPVDNEGKYHALIAVKHDPVMVSADIQKTRCKGQNIEIYFTLDGARKWADMTRNNTGKSLAFVISDQIYSMPVVNAGIQSGVALITGLENETVAKKLSDHLNSGLK